VAGTRTSLAELPIQYADWAAWQRAEVERGAYARQLEHWTKWLADVHRPTCPATGRGRPCCPTVARCTPSRCRRDSGPPLSTLGARERCTLYMTLFAAYLILVHRYTGKDDLVVGSVSAGRKRPEVARLLGFFANPLALRVDCSGDRASWSCCAASVTWRWRQCPTTTCRSSTWWPRCSRRATRAPPVLPDSDVARGADGTPARGLGPLPPRRGYAHHEVRPLSRDERAA